MDKFGWFYKRNGTTWADDVISMKTGLKEYSQLGDIVTWKGINRTHYPAECGQLKGKHAYNFFFNVTQTKMLTDL